MSESIVTQSASAIVKRMNEPSIFTKIINGDIPCHKVYEDEKTLAFLDIYAVTEGHTLVVPKNQVEFVWDLDTDEYDAVMATVRNVARHLRKELGVRYIGEKIIGTDVPHAHVHLIPFDSAHQMKEAGHQTREPDHAALAALAKKLSFS